MTAEDRTESGAPLPGAEPEAATDAELIARVREGDSAAYEELFVRHRDVAIRYARRISDAGRAEDLCAEAFAKILDLLQRGKGPQVAFRAYLLTTVRTSHLNTLRVGNREELVPDHEPISKLLPVTEDPDERFDRAAIFRAFSQLPERWQAALWLTAVEGMTNEEVGDRLGIKPNAVASLAFRARGGLRQAFLSEHLLAAPDPFCQRVLELLPSHLRGTLTRRRRTQVEDHLSTCANCGLAALELTEVETRLGALLAPLALTAVIGSGAAIPAGVTGSLLAGIKSAASTASGQVSGWVAGAPGLVGAKVAVAATVAAVGITVGAHTLDHDGPPAPQTPTSVKITDVHAPEAAAAPHQQRTSPNVQPTATPQSPSVPSAPTHPASSATPSHPTPTPDPRTGYQARTMSVGKMQTTTFERDDSTWNMVSIPVYHPSNYAVLNLTANRTRNTELVPVAGSDWECHPPVIAYIDGLLLHTVNTSCVYHGDGEATVLQMEYQVGSASHLTAMLVPPMGYLDLSLLDNVANLPLLN